MRIACVFVPQLALQAVLRRTPEARGGPVAVLAAANDNGKARAKSRGAQLGFAQRSPFAGGLGPSQGPKYYRAPRGHATFLTLVPATCSSPQDSVRLQATFRAG